MLNKLRLRIRALFFKSGVESELEEEVRFHLEKEAAQNAARGMSPEEARVAALRNFGGVERVKEESRDQRGIRLLEEVWQDLRHGGRVLLKHKGFSAVAALTLALGIGVNTAMFSVINTLLLQPMPYPEAGRLVRVYRTSSQSQDWPLSLPDFADLVAQNHEFDSLVGYSWWTCSLTEPGQPAEGIPGAAVTPSIFTAFGIHPTLGRGFTVEEQQPGRDRIVMLGYRFWQRRFAGDPGIIGRALRIDGQSLLVIGVMPDNVSYPLFWGRVDIWRPLPLPVAGDWRGNRSKLWLQVIGRLRPGVSIEQAGKEMTGLATRLAREFPATNAGAGLRLIPLQATAMDEVHRNAIWLTLGLAICVLLVACVNIANLHLARSAARARDFAVRAALGASRGRLLQQLFTESLLLALAGCLLGLALAKAINEGLSRRLEFNGETGIAFPLDHHALSFAVLVSIATGFLSGSMPAWFAARSDVNLALKQSMRGTIGDRSRHRLRYILIVAEIAFSLLLLAGSGFFICGLQRVTAIDPGWNTGGLLIGNISLPNDRYGRVEQRREFQEHLLRRLSELPGVERASLSSSLPIDASHASESITIEGRAEPRAGQEPLAHITFVSPGFFETLGLRLLEGRLFPSTIGHKDPPAAVINETMARRFWPNESALGKRIRGNDPDDREWHEVIGVVRDVTYPGHFGALDTRLQIYRPMTRVSWNNFTVAVRAQAPASLTETLRRAVAELDPDLPVAYPRTVEQALDYAQHNFQVVNQILGAFALLGLVLAAIGIYSVVSGIVAQRTQEFGVRMALGAREYDVIWLVLGKGGRLATLGILMGLVGAVGLWHVLSAIIPGLPGQDIRILILVAVLLFVVTLTACFLPAYRATKADPLVALRHE